MSVAVGPLAAIGILAALTLIAAIVDMRRLYIPDRVSLAIFLCGMAASFLFTVVEPLSALAGAVVGGALVWAVQVGFRRYRGYDGLGFGDVKFVAAGSAWTGVEGLAPALVVACLVALAYVLARRLADRSFDAAQPMPFAPALGVGFLAVATTQMLTGMPVIDLLLPL